MYRYTASEQESTYPWEL